MIDGMDDDQLLRLVADSLGAGPPPPDAVEAAYAAFSWRTLDAELALLIDEAQPEVVGFLLEPAQPAGAGAAAPVDRTVRFDTAHGSIDVTVGAAGLTVAVAPVPTRIVLRQPAAHRELAVDSLGRAPAPGVTGPARIEVTWPGGSAVTSWLTI